MEKFLEAAYHEAVKSFEQGGVPVGCVLVHDNKIIGRGHNRRVQKGSVILHGEMDALENAGRLSVAVYKECLLYTTLSPCAMCAGAILLYGIDKVVIGENTNFKGEEELLKSKGVQIVVADDMACKQLMRLFIDKNPEIWNEDIGV